MSRVNGIQALLGVLLLAAAVALWDWRAGVGSLGLMMWVDTWRLGR